MKNRVNTDKLFENIMGKSDVPEDNKKYQVSIYLTRAIDRELSIQGAIKEKEPDKSAIVRAALGIILSLSNEEYAKIKFAAKDRGVSPGQVIKELVTKYL